MEQHILFNKNWRFKAFFFLQKHNNMVLLERNSKEKQNLR